MCYCHTLFLYVYMLCQVQELHGKLSQETRRADNLAFEMKKLEEKHETVMKEKEVWQLLKCVKKIFIYLFIYFLLQLW